MRQRLHIVQDSLTHTQTGTGSPKVTIRPGFPGTVPIFNLKSREKSQASRDAHLSRFWPGVPDLSRLNKL